MSQLIIDADKCNHDGLCQAECPARAIDKPAKDALPRKAELFDEICLKCGHCVAVCPTGALALDWLAPEDCPPAVPPLAKETAENFLRTRRSIRRFKNQPVEPDKIEKLLQVACYAPSSKNVQPWEWIVINGKDKTDALDGLITGWMRAVTAAQPDLAEQLRFPRIISLTEAGQYQTLRNAPCLIVCHTAEDWNRSAQDSALALAYLELMAPSLGLGSCWSGYFMTAHKAHPPLAEAVPLPPGRKMGAALMLGYGSFKYLRQPVRNAPVIEWR